MNRLQQKAIEGAYKALCVISLDKAISAFLAQKDPKALAQVNNALGILEGADLGISICEARQDVRPDFLYKDEGTLFLLTPKTAEASEWIEENIPDDAQWFANALVVEHRYIQGILSGIGQDGLTYEPENGRIPTIWGTCPACHKVVYEGEDVVWTCAHNLNKDNPLFIGPQSEGAHCPCEYELPIHESCYNNGTW